MNDQEIEAEFDPNDKKDIEWVTEEIMKILEETPEIKKLENQLGMSKKVHDPLDEVVEHLKKITDVSTMVKDKEEAEKKADAKAKAADDKKKADEKKKDEKLPPAKTKTTADGKKTPADAAPSKGGKPASGKVPEVTKEEGAKATAAAPAAPAKA